jgi:hypothetical protein
MNNGIVKGTRVGVGAPGPVQSETTEPAARSRASYTCVTNKHAFSVPFAADADVPDFWPCPKCSSDAYRLGADPSAVEAVAGPARRPLPGGKTEWEQLMGRRTREEGEKILADALAKLRASRGEQQPRRAHG